MSLPLNVHKDSVHKDSAEAMFALPAETSERVAQALAQRICTAADGSYIRRSSGQRRAGRDPKYTVHMAQGEAFVITAPSDEAAVALANERAAQLWDKAYILAHCVCDAKVREALQQATLKEQVARLRRELVLAAAAGYEKPGPFYFTSGGRIYLCDTLLVQKTNVRSYGIAEIARLAISRARAEAGMEQA